MKVVEDDGVSVRARVALQARMVGRNIRMSVPDGVRIHSRPQPGRRAGPTNDTAASVNRVVASPAVEPGQRIGDQPADVG
jgi:hypothetical protein